MGAPYKTQQVVREVQDQLYTNTPGGLAGNDDLGAMSSWYVWSALGGYPEMPGSATLALGSPMFSNIAIHLGNGKTITESAPQASDHAPYVQGVSVNGSSWDRAYLPPSLIKQGGTVDWTLATTPSTTWASATNDAPPSDTQGLMPALGYVSGPGSDANSMVVTSPGTSATLTLGAQSMTDAAQTISWTASTTSGSGLQVGPGSGSMFVGKEAKATQQIQVTVPSGTADGVYPVTFQMRSATGTALPAVVEVIAVASPGDLAPYYNSRGVSSDSDQAAANFDGDGFSYSEQALAAQGISPGATVTSGGVRYTWPSATAGQPDNVLAGGQTIKLLPVSGATKIGVLGSATNGPSTGQMTITYSDGTTQQASLGLSDWTLNANSSSPSDGNVETATTPYRNSVAGQAQTINTYLFSASFPVAAGKTVASVTLPASTDEGSIHLFALGSDQGPLTS